MKKKAATGLRSICGSHGQIDSAYSHLGKTAADIPLRKRCELMIEMLEDRTNRNNIDLLASDDGSFKRSCGKNVNEAASRAALKIQQL